MEEKCSIFFFWKIGAFFRFIFTDPENARFRLSFVGLMLNRSSKTFTGFWYEILRLKIR